jgi:serine/threonine-protein kinase
MSGLSRQTLQKRLGQRVKGRYRLLDVVGTGGQGAVYSAIDERDGDRVAVKILHSEVAEDPNARERLVREARALMVLTGTAALEVLDQGFTEDGNLALVTELLLGEELEDLLLRTEQDGERLAVADALAIFEPIAETLNRAHELGIVHRDLKPGNVFLTPTDTRRVRLMDFGFAKFGHLSSLTGEGFVAGSPSYLSPEAWRNEAVSPSMDVYGFSAMLFRVLAGVPPFAGKDTLELFRVCTGAPRPSLHALRPELPADVDNWVGVALAIDPAVRFLNAGASLSALRGLLT